MITLLLKQSVGRYFKCAIHNIHCFRPFINYSLQVNHLMMRASSFLIIGALAVMSLTVVNGKDDDDQWWFSTQS